MKAKITLVEINHNEKNYRVNIYGSPKWRTWGKDWRTVLTGNYSWILIDDFEVPKEVKDARRRAQSA